jgi:hypothetical protein
MAESYFEVIRGGTRKHFTNVKTREEAIKICVDNNTKVSRMGVTDWLFFEERVGKFPEGE